MPVERVAVILTRINTELNRLSNAEQAAFLQRFFKTGPGQYGEGDRFRGIRVPVLRKLAKQYQTIEIAQADILLQSEYHEDRMLALFIMILIFKKADQALRKRIYKVYLSRTDRINNWDLVDLSAEHIVGCYLLDKAKTPLFELARSDRLWERRIAVMATFHYIKRNEFTDALAVIGIVLGDHHDLMHKAAGWMLREIGKRDLAVEEQFLAGTYKSMPRTMLRYAIEKFPETKRKAYLHGTIPEGSRLPA
jgi:3-methyladenine DNA glycosylase AlkD